MERIGDLAPSRLHEWLRTGALQLDYGAATVRVRSPSRALAAQLRRVYVEFDAVPPAPFTDLHVRLDPARGLRRLVRPQIVFSSDGRQEFHPFPADTALPLLEWGTNWLIGQRLHHRLLLHAGALERDGLGLLLPAVPGSGKSTLTAALSQRGWRLLSDEFGVCDPDTLALEALLKPIALKNRSIDVIRAFAPTARLGPTFPKTRKGDVAHLAADAEAVRRRREPARPAAVILPRWHTGAPTTLRPIDEEAMFRALAFNSFNYAVLGAVGFRTALAVVRQCVGWQLVYSDLDDAVRVLDALWPEVRAAAARRPVSDAGSPRGQDQRADAVV